MPIYAYRCSTCGRAKDVLQKMSDPVLTECPFCGAPTFVKQVTAAGFQLKGSGWYVTDFRGDSKAPKAADGVVSAESSKSEAPSSDSSKSESSKAEPSKSSGTGGDSSAAPAASKTGSAAPASAPAPAAPSSGSSSSGDK